MKRIVSIFLMTAMIICSFGICCHGAGETVSDDMTAEETGLLTTLNLLSEEDLNFYNKDFAITRAAFVRIVNRVMKIAVAAADEIPFWDIQSDNEYFGDIAAAYEAGLIDGEKGDRFRPYDTITYSEAVKIVGVGMGYKKYADAKGGYPFGYLLAARQAGYDIKDVDGEKELGFKCAVRILFSALNAYTPKLDRIYNDVPFYTVRNEDTLLFENFDVEKVCGIVEANDVTNVSFGGNETNDGIMIDGVIYKCGDISEYRDLIGYRVNCYYIDNDDTRSVLYAAKEKNKTLSIDSEDIISASTKEIVYSNGSTGKRRVQKLNASISYLYNGKSLNWTEEYSDKLIKDIDEGGVLLIDNNSDGTYDVLSITSYTNYVVDGANESSFHIYGKYNSGEPLVLNNDVKWSAVDTMGESRGFAELVKGMSLMAAVSKDKSYVRIICCDDIIEGKVKTVTGKDEIVINGKTYKISVEYLNGGEKINAGAEGVFYLNANGRIVKFDHASYSDGRMGFLIKAISDFYDEVEASIMSDEDDKALHYKLAEKVEIDGSSYKTSEKIIKRLVPDDVAVGEVIRYWTDEDGKINRIDTPMLGENESAENTLIKRWSRDDSILEYKSTGRIGGRFYINASSGILYGLDKVVKSSDNITLYTPSALSDDQKISCDVYSVGKDKITADAMVMLKDDIEGSGGGEKVPISNWFCVFEEYSHGLNDEGEIVGILSYYDGTAKSTAYVEAEDEALIPDLAQLKCGDAFVIKKDKKNYLRAHLRQSDGYTNLYRIYDYENDKFLFDEQYNTGRYKLSTGVVYELTDDYARVGAKGLDYMNMPYWDRDKQLEAYLIYYSYNGGGVYEVLRNNTLSVSVPSAETVLDYASAGGSADRIIAQREYGHDRRNCYFRHSK